MDADIALQVDGAGHRPAVDTRAALPTMLVPVRSVPVTVDEVLDGLG